MTMTTEPMTASGTLKQGRRVNYAFGMVLGEADFRQEQFYLLERDRLHQRALHGYGTVYGLQVEQTPDAGDIKISVSPGLAVDQYGRDIQIDPEQCAFLNAWLARNADAVRGKVDETGNLRLYLVLRYAECLDETVPIPGTSCRTDDTTLAPSRIVDAYDLRLLFEPPAQIAENAVRTFGILLDRIELTDDSATPAADRDALLAAVRLLATDQSVPAAPSVFALARADACAVVADAIEAWVTEVRPALLPPPCEPGDECAPTQDDLFRQHGILLAQFDFAVAVGDASTPPTINGALAIDTANRPLLLHTRLLQEWLTCARFANKGVAAASKTFATIEPLSGNFIRAWVHHPEPLTINSSDITVTVDGVTIASPPVVNAFPAFDLVFEVNETFTGFPDNARVEIRFHAATIVNESGETLKDRIIALGREYADHEDDDLLAFAIYHPNTPIPPPPPPPDVITFAVLGAVGANVVRAWLPPEPGLAIPQEALSVLVDNNPVPSDAFTVSQVGGDNVIDITFNTPVPDGSRVGVGFNLVTLGLATDGRVYLNRLSDTVMSYVIFRNEDAGDVVSPPTPDSITFATLGDVGANVVRAWLHHPTALTVPPEAVSVFLDEDADPRGDVTVAQQAGVNVVDITFSDSVPDSGRIRVRFDLAQIGISADGRAYADRDADSVNAFLIFDAPPPPVVIPEPQPQPAPDPLPAVVDKLRVFPLATVTTRSDGRVTTGLLIWLHLDAPGNAVAIEKLAPTEGVQVFEENADPAANFLREIPIREINPVSRNLFLATLTDQTRAPLLRVQFNTEAIAVRVGFRGRLSEYRRKVGIVFEGSGERETVTVFVINAGAIG